ncbi:caspase family protein [Streptomyces sp. L7]
MGQYRALLIGASDYSRVRGVQSLAFIPSDLDRLRTALQRRGFGEIETLFHQSGNRVGANDINGEVSKLLQHAQSGDTLIIMLSGHGVHANGRDYLVPEDIYAELDPFEDYCVAIDWSRELENSSASRVVILIDACREGIERDSKSVVGIKEWGRQKIDAAVRRKVAYFYACSPAQLSLFVRSDEYPLDSEEHGTRPGESFSIFSRAVSDVIADSPQMLTLEDFKNAVQLRIGELHKVYRKKGMHQRCRIVTDIPLNEFNFLPQVATVQPEGRVQLDESPANSLEVTSASTSPQPEPYAVQYKRLSGTATVYAIAFDPGSRWIATAVRGRAEIWDIANRKCFREMRAILD